MTPASGTDGRERFCSIPGPDQLSPELLDRHRPNGSWLAEGPGGDTARCSLWWTDAPPLPGERLGVIGHYSAGSADPAATLLQHACTELAARGCTLAVGPMDGNTWRRYRLVTERGPEPPFFLEPDNPDDWPGHFAAAGFTPLSHYYSAVNDDLAQTDDRAGTVLLRAEEYGITFRNLDPSFAEAELTRVHALSLTAFAGNYLFTPIALDEFLDQYRNVLAIARPELILLAEQGDDLAGYLFALPDLAQARRGAAVDTAVFKTMAVRPDLRGIGLGGLLMAKVHASAARQGYRRAVHALMHADNPSRRISLRGARTIRRYTLFAKRLRGGP